MLFEDMSDQRKLNHIKNCCDEALLEVRGITCSADILDVWDYWLPWLFEKTQEGISENNE